MCNHTVFPCIIAPGLCLSQLFDPAYKQIGPFYVDLVYIRSGI